MPFTFTVDTPHSAAVPAMDTLTGQLTNDVGLFNGYLDDARHPRPSYDRDAPPNSLPDDAPEHVQLARERIMANALQLFNLAAGPSEILNNLSTGYHYVACLRWLCHFNVFALVPLQDRISYPRLATLANVSQTQLKSIARMAMTMYLFSEPSPGEIAHTATSALLQRNRDFYEWAVFMCEMSAPTAANLLEASLQWRGSAMKTETAYNAAFGTNLPFFQHLSQFPDRTRQFSGYMKSVTNSPGNRLKHLVNGYDWAALGEALVVDVGGSTGHASIALAEAYSALSFVIQDLPEVMDRASHDNALSSSLQFHAHDFFQPQPVSGASVYLLRMILHDWPDEDAARILANLVPAMSNRSRVLVMDIILPAPGSVPVSRERILRLRDMTMMQVFNSHERGLDDWKAVFQKADGRLRLLNVHQPVGSAMSLMELGLD
ncbi:o-methyltransferase [Aspergillus sp. HF37]|nr:o-methyltransferase [Aspergillus sp. HF37]